MEMEKGTCCNEKGCGNCDKKECSCGEKCCMCWKKCWKIRKVLWIVLMALIFSLGIQIGEIKSYRHGNNECGMMNWNYKNISEKKGLNKQIIDDSIKGTDTSKGVAPEVKQ